MGVSGVFPLATRRQGHRVQASLLGKPHPRPWQRNRRSFHQTRSVATIFNREKTKWLNILHAGWPGGLVIAGIITIYIDTVPCGYQGRVDRGSRRHLLVHAASLHIPVQEREAAGVLYKEMLAEFGILGAAVVGFLVSLQLIDFFSIGGDLPATQRYIFWGIGAAIVLLFGLYHASSRPLPHVFHDPDHDAARDN